jgi:hypothetical protein
MAVREKKIRFLRQDLATLLRFGFASPGSLSSSSSRTLLLNDSLSLLNDSLSLLNDSLSFRSESLSLRSDS